MDEQMYEDIKELLENLNDMEDGFTGLVEGIWEINESLKALNSSIEKLGLNGADTRMGAIELLAKEVSELKDKIK